MQNNQNGLKRKRDESTDETSAYEPPRKIRVLDENQTYISESSTNSSYDGSTTDGDISIESDDKESSNDRAFLETTQEIPKTSDIKGNGSDKNDDESAISIDIPEDNFLEEDRQTRLRKQWNFIKPKLKRTTTYCDMADECSYHFPGYEKKDDDDEHMCCSC